MCNSNIRSDVDKIAFVRSQLVPNSLASQLMTASGLDPKLLNNDYSRFRTNFLQIFGVPVNADSFQWVYRFADTLTNNLGNVGHLRAQAVTAQIAAEALESLKTANWIVNDSISVDRLRIILEYLMYVPLLTPQEKRLASSLDFKLDDTIFDFSLQIGKKLNQSPVNVNPVAPFVPSAFPQVAAFLPQTKEPVSQKSQTKRYCTYCKTDGHEISRCFQRKRDSKKSAKASSSSSKQTPVVTGHHPQQANVTSSSSCCSSSCQAASNSSAFQRTPKYCAIHDLCNHSTEECSVILGHKANRTRTMFERPPKHCAIHDWCNHSTEECDFVLEKKRDFVVTHAQSNFHQRPHHKNTR